MATFKVTVESIGVVNHHQNADKLDVCSLEGINFQFVTGRDQFKPGDKVVYFPIDSVLVPDVIETLGLTGKLSGAARNRIRTLTLRGVVSQGVVSHITNFLSRHLQVGTDVTDYLSVTKWEPPDTSNRSGDLIQLPSGLSAYDIEGCERYDNILEQLMDIPVCVTEKLEGANFSCTALPDGTIYVNQRNFSIKESDHDFWRVSRSTGLLDKALKWAIREQQQVTIYGEFIGPSYQSNIYKLNKHQISTFDVLVGTKWVDAHTWYGEFDTNNNTDRVPVLAWNVTLREWLAGRSVKEASSGPSTYNPKQLREGIVIKPMIEQYVQQFGRLILKQRDPIYLSKSEY